MGFDTVDAVSYTHLDVYKRQGEYISEIGLYDSAGDIVCIKTFTKRSPLVKQTPKSAIKLLTNAD